MQKLMQGVYKYNFKVLRYNCDMKKELTLCALMKETERISTGHLEVSHADHHTLFSNNMIFVLSKIGFIINRMPRAGEEITAVTTPQGIRGVNFLRKVQFGNQKGEVLVECQSSWVLIDPISKKILRPKQFTFKLEWDENEPDNLMIDKHKLLIPQSTDYSYTKEVRYSDLDLNKHMNNTVYSAVIADALPFDIVSKKTPTQFYLHYKREALLADKMQINISSIEDNGFFVSANDNNGDFFTSNIYF